MAVEAVATLGVWNEGWLILLFLFARSSFFLFGECCFFLGRDVDICDFAEELAFSSINLHREGESHEEEKRDDQFCRGSCHGRQERKKKASVV